jgi:hypothetical protein
VLERRGLASGSDEEASPPPASAPRSVSPQKARPVAERGGGGGLAAAARAALRGVEPELFNPEELLSSGVGLGGVCWG